MTEKLKLFLSDLGAKVLAVQEAPHCGVIYVNFTADEPSIKKILN